MPELLIKHKGGFCRCQYDKEDEVLVNCHTWYILGGYVATKIDGKSYLLHRLILNVSNPDLVGDHINGDPLNNKRSNLRLATRAENRRNSRKNAPASSIYKGSYLEKDRNLFHSQISFDKRTYNLGRYSDEKLAAKAYDRRALEVFGEFAYVNFQSSKEASQLKFAWI